MNEISQEDKLFDEIVRILGIERRLATTTNLLKRARAISEFRKYGNSREIEGRIDERRHTELPFKGDHSKCIDHHNCMGYMNADADLRGENELRIAELESQKEKTNE